MRSEAVWMGRRIQSCVPGRGVAVRGLWGAGIYCAMNGFVDGGLFRTYGAPFPFWLLYHRLRTANAALACGYRVSRLRRLLGGAGYNPAFRGAAWLCAVCGELDSIAQ